MWNTPKTTIDIPSRESEKSSPGRLNEGSVANEAKMPYSALSADIIQASQCTVHKQVWRSICKNIKYRACPPHQPSSPEHIGKARDFGQHCHGSRADKRQCQGREPVVQLCTCTMNTIFVWFVRHPSAKKKLQTNQNSKGEARVNQSCMGSDFLA